MNDGISAICEPSFNAMLTYNLLSNYTNITYLYS